MNDTDKITDFFKTIEKSFEKYPRFSEKVSNIPVLVQMVKSYVSVEYREIPVRSIIAIVSALVYWVSPIDLIPDPIPVLGFVDDVKVISICIELVDKDIVAYKKWREMNIIVI